MKDKKTFKDFLTEGVEDPSIFKAVFLAGGPGSGKTFVAHKTMPNAILGMKFINSDQQLEFLLKKAQVSADMLTMSPQELERFYSIRDRARELTKKKMEIYLAGRLGMIIDGTGRDYNKITSHKQSLEKVGYDTYMIFVNTSLEVALERNRQRDRKVAESLVVQFWKDVQKNIGAFQSAFGSGNFIIIDNNNADENVFLKVYKEIVKFTRRPPRNAVAKQWIDIQRGRGK